MRNAVVILAIAAVAGFLMYGCATGYVTVQPQANARMNVVAEKPMFASTSGSNIALPMPRYKGSVSVEEALKNRRSVRSYSDAPLTLEDVSQLLWAGQGITSKDGRTPSALAGGAPKADPPPADKRTAPSAAAMYPIELYVIAMNVTGLNPGVYHYVTAEHSLARVKEGDVRNELLESSGRNQQRLQTVPILIVIAGDFDKAKKRFSGGAQGRPGMSEDTTKGWVYAEVGHVSENIYLQCESLGFGTVAMGGFDAKKINALLGLTYNLPDGKAGVASIYMMPVGKKK